MLAPLFYSFRKIGTPWGDYGSVLTHGMSMQHARHEGCIQLVRPGPHIDPITFPFAADVVVTESFRQALRASGLTGFTFRPVIKYRISELHWQDWDVSAEDPPEYPPSGEPQDYVLGRPHSPKAAAELGNLWELVVHDGVHIARDEKGFHLLTETWDGTDFFETPTMTTKFLSPNGRKWLAEHFGDFVDIIPIMATA